MPQNRRESFIFTIMMCFVMVLWMSIYNIALQENQFNFQVLQIAWLGMPIAYVFALLCDWFVVSNLAKSIAFKHFLKDGDHPFKMALVVSTCMVIPMVIVMSMYGSLEVAFSTGDFSNILYVWITNIPKNFIMALPFQLIIAGPLVRFVFRKLFPVGTVLA